MELLPLQRVLRWAWLVDARVDTKVYSYRLINLDIGVWLISGKVECTADPDSWYPSTAFTDSNGVIDREATAQIAAASRTAKKVKLVFRRWDH
jgi:hypothetical protein